MKRTLSVQMRADDDNYYKSLRRIVLLHEDIRRLLKPVVPSKQYAFALATTDECQFLLFCPMHFHRC